MATFFMFGNYTPKAIKKISLKRTDQAVETIQALGGKVKGIYALLGEYDLVFCVNLPDIEAAMKASVKIAQSTGISFRTCPAVKVKVFDRLAADI